MIAATEENSTAEMKNELAKILQNVDKASEFAKGKFAMYFCLLLLVINLLIWLIFFILFICALDPGSISTNLHFVCCQILI